jgi:Protein of unknown function (DUF3570)
VLAALTTSALALPGLAGRAAAEGPPPEISADYSYGQYREDPLPASKVANFGERHRYVVDMQQLHLGAPIGSRFDVGLDVSYETMSGASPWYVLPGPTGQPLQVMSGATISDQRVDTLLSGSYYLDSGKATLRGGASVERDYLAINGSLEGERQFNEKNTTLLGGAGLSIDHLTPTDADRFPTRPDSANKQSYSVFAGIAQVVGRQSVIQSTITYQHENGFLSDPYKLASVGGDVVADARPGQRNQIAWLTRFRHHFSAIDGTLHADYRFYVDDWNVNSHTLELAWYQSLWDAIQIVPSLRYYTQSQARFYAPYYDGPRADAHYSSDYRLSPYGALSWRIKAETHFATWNVRWKAQISWERYTSSGDLALGKVRVENPGLVSFNLFSIGLSGNF